MATPVVELGQLYLRLASPRDVPHIRMLIVGLARFEKLEHECFATDEKLHRSLFDDPARAPFKVPKAAIFDILSHLLLGSQGAKTVLLCFLCSPAAPAVLRADAGQA